MMLNEYQKSVLRSLSIEIAYALSELDSGSWCIDDAPDFLRSVADVIQDVADGKIVEGEPKWEQKSIK